LLVTFRNLILVSLVFSLNACVSINTVPNAGGQNAQKEKNDDDEIVREKTVKLDEAANFNMSLGAQYLKKGNINQAIAKLEKAISQEPNLTLAHSYLGLAYEKIGETENANKHYLKAVNLEADNPVSANNYGTFLCRHNQIEKSLAYFEKAGGNTRYQTPEAAYSNAGVCARKIPDNARAKDYFVKALQYKPKSAEVLWNLADLSIDQNDLSQAEKYYKAFSLVLPKGQDNADQLLLAYRMAVASGDTNLASRYADRLNEKFPGSEQSKKL